MITSQALQAKILSNPLTAFWKTQQLNLPILTQLARRVFVAQATEAASERVFSLSGHVLRKRRRRLSPDLVSAILMINSEQRYSKKEKDNQNEIQSQ